MVNSFLSFMTILVNYIILNKKSKHFLLALKFIGFEEQGGVNGEGGWFRK
jgi:hypothetical protein